MNLSSKNFAITKHNTEIEEELECTSLHLLQDAKEASIIEASKLLVEGTTEKYSSQFSHTAKINTHKGVLRCHQADINTLDGGEIHATQANIYNCLRGSVHAQDIIVDNLETNVTLFASNSITVHNIHGSHNTFTIDYKKVPILISKLELIQSDLDYLILEQEEAKKHNHSIIPKINVKIKKLKQDKTSIIESYKSAKITLNNSVPKENKIIFSINDSMVEYTTKEQFYTPFYLSFRDDTITLHPSKIELTF